MKVTLLGTGTSQGVPVIACECNVCLSNDPKDKRLRSSVIVEVDNQNIVIDTGPDFRQQMLREKITDVDAILFTHHHTDHVIGIDDIRAFNYKWKKDMDVYCSTDTGNALKNVFPYIFEDNAYPGVPRININTIKNESFKIKDLKIVPIKAMHYKMPIYGFRINKFIYLTDVSDITKEEKKKMMNADLIILDSLQRKKHISHFNLEQSLELLNELKPKQALLTHISHFMGLHELVNRELPNNIQLAYDGQSIELSEN